MKEEKDYPVILTQVIKNEKAIIKVYRPVLDDEERERRMKEIHDAAAALMRSALKARAKKDDCTKCG